MAEDGMQHLNDLPLVAEKYPNRKRNGWIKCSEQMPEYDCPIIIYTKDLEVKPACFRIWRHVIELVEVEAFEDEEGCSFTIYPDQVTHWQPLPSPPED